MPQQETIQAGYAEDIPHYQDSAQSEAAQAQFSIEDYGREGDQRPYQVVQPSYPAPRFLQRFSDLKSALRECKTLCRLEGKPFRVVRWGRSGAGARGGIPCKTCRNTRPTSRFPLMGCLAGYPDAVPLAEVQPDGRRLVFDCKGYPKIVGKPAYIVSANPFPRTYQPQPLPQTYLQAVKTAQAMVSERGRRAYIVASFANKGNRDPKYWVPVVYVDPGGLREVQDTSPTGPTTVKPISRQEFKELLAESKGASFLPKGA